MVGFTTSFRQWLEGLQPIVTRQFDQLFYYLGVMDVPSRLIVFLAAVVFCSLVLNGLRPKSAH